MCWFGTVYVMFREDNVVDLLMEACGGKKNKKLIFRDDQGFQKSTAYVNVKRQNECNIEISQEAGVQRGVHSIRRDSKGYVFSLHCQHYWLTSHFRHLATSKQRERCR